MEEVSEMEEERVFNPEERIPCTDDMCTGTINEKGRCNYCKKAYSGTPPQPLPTEFEEEDAVAAEDIHEAPEREVAAPDWDQEERIPCMDDLCTGTINEQGRCNYCGKSLK